MYCWCASHLRACRCCCIDAGQTHLPPCHIRCSAVRIQELQDNYVKVELELRLLFIRFCSQQLQVWSGYFEFLRALQHKMSLSECEPNDSLLSLLGGSNTRIKIWCLALLVGSYRNPFGSCPQAHCGTTYTRKPYWESSANIRDHCSVQDNKKPLNSCPRAHCCPWVKKWDNRLVLSRAPSCSCPPLR